MSSGTSEAPFGRTRTNVQVFAIVIVQTAPQAAGAAATIQAGTGIVGGPTAASTKFKGKTEAARDQALGLEPCPAKQVPGKAPGTSPRGDAAHGGRSPLEAGRQRCARRGGTSLCHRQATSGTGREGVGIREGRCQPVQWI